MEAIRPATPCLDDPRNTKRIVPGEEGEGDEKGRMQVLCREKVCAPDHSTAHVLNTVIPRRLQTMTIINRTNKKQKPGQDDVAFENSQRLRDTEHKYICMYIEGMMPVPNFSFDFNLQRCDDEHDEDRELFGQVGY